MVDHHLRARSTIDEVARRSYGKLVALLSAQMGDLAAAEDAISDAFVSALKDWTEHGCPTNPEGWLIAVARRRLIDLIRRQRVHTRVVEELASSTCDVEVPNDEAVIPDHRLGLMFACAHPAIDSSVRAPLILQAVLGLNAATIASAFLVSPASMSQRLVRAKHKIKQAGIPFRIPNQAEMGGRTDDVLNAIYAVFTEGWTDPDGTHVECRQLATEAIALGRLVVELIPSEPEAIGLLSLMLHAHARRDARRDSRGDFVPFAVQDLSKWDWNLIHEAELLLGKASAMHDFGRFQLEAALQSAHVVRRLTGQNNWPAIVQLYDALFTLNRSPVVAINRALAVAEVHGFEPALRELDRIGTDPRVEDYQPYWAARADILSKMGDVQRARHAYEMAIGLERDDAVRRFLQSRLAGC